MKYIPAIVVVAYNRRKTLARLLRSLSEASYPEVEINLVISVDKSDSEEVAELAEAFDWPYGNKRVVIQAVNLGLRKHILQCGDYAEVFGSIIMLEDDLMVSPQFYHYTQAALGFYESDDRIGGISLYHMNRTDDTLSEFMPLEDGFDNYFVQLPSSWGQAWTKGQWTKFRAWIREHSLEETQNDLSLFVQGWSAHSWKKSFLAYLISKNLFFVYPRVGLSTNFHSSGTNSQSASSRFQCALLWGEKTFRFSLFEESNLKYDQYVECLSVAFIKENNPNLSAYDFELDLRGGKTKAEIKTEYVITCQKNKSSILSFSHSMQPLEWNLLKNVEGEGLYLCKKEAIQIPFLTKVYNRIRPYYFTTARLKNKFLLALKEVL